MLDHQTKIRMLPDWRGRWQQLYFLITLILVTSLVSGCISTSPKQHYENPEFGISLKKPQNWDLAYDERSGTIVLESKNEARNKDSARVEIHDNACAPTPPWFTGPYKELESSIDRIRILYSLDSVTIVQEPIKVETEDYEVIKAVITIPTMSLQENAIENQVGNRDPSIFQTIEIFAISGGDYFTMAYIYKGNSEKLNDEAEEIVTSIQLICSK